MAPSTLTKGRRALLFDIDGTLADTVPAIIAGLGDAFERFAGFRPPSAELKAMIGGPLSEQMSLHGLHQSKESSLDERLEFAMARFRAHKTSNALFQPAIEAWRHAASIGWLTALVTSKHRSELSDFLDDFPVFREARAVVSASDVQRPKPAPDSARLACSLLGVRPSEAIFVGDSVFDLLCAHRAGMPCIAVSYGAASAEQLIPHRPDMLLDTPEQLRDWAINDLPVSTCHARNQPIRNLSWAPPSP